MPKAPPKSSGTTSSRSCVGAKPDQSDTEDFDVFESRLQRWLKITDVEDGIKPGLTQADAAELWEARKRKQESEILPPGCRVSVAGIAPQMMFPLVLGLAPDRIPITVTYRVLGFRKLAVFRWRANPVPQCDWDNAPSSLPSPRAPPCRGVGTAAGHRGRCDHGRHSPVRLHPTPLSAAIHRHADPGITQAPSCRPHDAAPPRPGASFRSIWRAESIPAGGGKQPPSRTAADDGRDRRRGASTGRRRRPLWTDAMGRGTQSTDGGPGAVGCSSAGRGTG